MTATHAHGAGAIDAKSRESPIAPPVPLDDPANDAAQRTGRVPGGQVSRKQSARHRGGSTMTLNKLRPGYQRIADIYGLPVNIIQDPLNGKFIAWAGNPGASGAAIGLIIETIVPQKPPEGPPTDHCLERAMLTRVLSAPKA
jgi:hypothetical protein